MLFRKKAEPVFSMIGTDIHSHLIPGIDDGCPDMGNSLEMARGLSQLGFKKIITTPHIMWDMYKNTREDILEKVKVLQEAVSAEGIELEIEAAAEYFLDDYVAGLLTRRESLLTISDNLVLVEFSLASLPLDLKDTLFELQLQGYQPVIAHPERYIYSTHQKEFFRELKDAGYLFQLNILSLIGFYGKQPMEQANYLARHEYYELVGTDLHNARHLQALRDPAITNPLKKLLDSGKIRNAEL